MSSQVKKVIPLLDRILVKRANPVQKSKGGIVIPEDSQTKNQEGLVIAVGPGAKNENGAHIPISLKEGDKVLLPQYGGTPMDKKDYVLMRECDILAKIE